MQDRADAATDKIESRLLQRLMSVYDGALEQALKNNKAFFQKIKDLEMGKIKPPASVASDPEKLAKWKQGFYRELMRRENVVKDIANRLAEAGGEASEEIREAMREVYSTNNEYVRDMVADANGGVTFAAADKRQLEVIMQENESPFSKIAYKNLGSNTKVREMLQRELGIATLNGESQREIIARIRKVAGMTSKQAKRVVQTERTRVQSQARWQAGESAKALGVEIVNEWSTRMVNSRDTHVALNGKKAPQGERFPGSVLRFPGDPEGPAHEVINCHCVLVPDVVAPSGSKNKLKGKATNREEAYDILKNGVGFADVSKSLDYIDEETIIAQTNQLYKLNQKFGAIGADFGGYIGAENSKQFAACTRGSFKSAASQNLVYSFDDYAHGTEFLRQKVKKSIVSGWSMPCLEENYLVYTTTHEYGHILLNKTMSERINLDDFWEKYRNAVGNASPSGIKKGEKLIQKTSDEGAKSIFMEILDIAKEKNQDFSLRANISDYGKTSYQEAFAEVFANSQLGKPNELGDAMNVWLERNGF